MNLDLLSQLFEAGPMPLVRTDFTDDAAWQQVIVQAASERDFGGESYAANVEAVSDLSFDGATAGVLADAWPRESAGYVALADTRTMHEAAAGAEVTLAVVDLYSEEEDEQLFGAQFGQEFRCAVEALAEVEANLSIANADFVDFANTVDADGVYRGAN